MMLYNNGYIIKDLVDNEELSINNTVYRGLQSYHSWPLNKEEDSISKELTKLAEKCFDENNYMEIMPDTKLLKKYVNHCVKLEMKVMILKIMSADNTSIANEELKEIEVLGYDCMAGDSVSYLSEIHTECGDEFESYKSIKSKLNSNGLLNTYEEVEDFIKKRKKLLEQGINLEDYWKPVVVRISLVVFE